MRHGVRFFIVHLCSASILLFAASCSPEAAQPSDSNAAREAHNTSVVKEYFRDVLDGKRYDRMTDLFTPDVAMHRPEGTLTYLGVILAALQKALSAHTIETTIHETVASGDFVTVRLTHKLTFSREQAVLQSRVGTFDVKGKTIEWDAMAMFRFRDGRIAEEWVSPDELGQLTQIGTVQVVINGQ
jgi:predicted SnoaL-like aldol condensation-catalyzing enzyme